MELKVVVKNGAEMLFNASVSTSCDLKSTLAALSDVKSAVNKKLTEVIDDGAGNSIADACSDDEGSSDDDDSANVRQRSKAQM